MNNNVIVCVCVRNSTKSITAWRNFRDEKSEIMDFVRAHIFHIISTAWLNHRHLMTLPAIVLHWCWHLCRLTGNSFFFSSRESLCAKSKKKHKPSIRPGGSSSSISICVHVYVIFLTEMQINCLSAWIIPRVSNKLLIICTLCQLGLTSTTSTLLLSPSFLTPFTDTDLIAKNISGKLAQLAHSNLI